MRTNKRKKGISLIVLIITIIVMIILAAAIILSLNNSGIIDRANKAKTDSDAANLKEYANVLMAEWELMTAEEKEATNCSSSIEYVNAKFNEKGYKNKTYSADGDIYTDLSEMAKNAIVQGLKIGDEVKYIIAEEDKKEYEPDLMQTGSSSGVLTTQTNLTWRYIGVNDDGELLITADVSNEVLTGLEVQVNGCGVASWEGLERELNTICDRLYSVEQRVKARNMNIDDIIRLLDYTGEKGAYKNTSGKYTPTVEPMTITDIANKIDHIIEEESFKTYTPKSDYFTIDKTKDIKEIKDSKYIDLIYPYSGSYWLSSVCMYADFENEIAVHYLRCVTTELVDGIILWNTTDFWNEDKKPLRPVLALKSDFQLTCISENIWSVSFT